jgi:hypothetical protein
MISSSDHPGGSVVYARSLRAAALGVLNRPEDHEVLQKDVDWLVKASLNGAYGDDALPGVFLNGVTSTGNPFASVSPPAATPQPPADQYQGRTVITPGMDGHTLLDAFGRPVMGCTPDRPHRIELPGSTATPVEMWIPVGPYSEAMSNAYTPDFVDTSLNHYAGRPIPFLWDNFNSEYGLLGVSAGARAGCMVPDTYWSAAENHWNNSVMKDGQCGFSPQSPAPNPNTSIAAAASLLACHERLDWVIHRSSVGVAPYNAALTASLGWMATGYNVVNVVGSDIRESGPALFSVERTALEDGSKYFGAHDWYHEFSDKVIARQSANGAWGDSANDASQTPYNTAYMLLFLSQGRSPVLMNKLQFRPAWDNRPRDVANLARFAGVELGRPFRWRAVGLDRPWSDWTDSPILYIASHQAPALTDDDCQKLKEFAEAGGMILTHSDTDYRLFDIWVEQLQKRLWPQYELKTIPRDSVIYSSKYQLAADKNIPALAGVCNGSRYLLVHCPTDALSGAWADANVDQTDRFQLGVNLFVYAAGAGNFRNRIDVPYLTDPAKPATAAIKIARLKYDGNWDPEPYAWIRFGRLLNLSCGIATDTATVEMSELKPDTARLAAVTGTAAVEFTDAQVAAVRTFVQSGGTLLVDSTGGHDEFAGSARNLLHRAFPEIVNGTDLGAARPPGGTSNIDDLTGPAGRAFNLEKHLPVPAIRVFRAGAGRVVFTPLDLTSGLLGTHTWGISGYEPEYAQAVVAAIVQTAVPSH